MLMNIAYNGHSGTGFGGLRDVPVWVDERNDVSFGNMGVNRHDIERVVSREVSMEVNIVDNGHPGKVPKALWDVPVWVNEGNDVNFGNMGINLFNFERRAE